MSREALAQLWTGIYDITEELVATDAPDSPLEPLTDPRADQRATRGRCRGCGTHVLYVEEYPYDEPFELRRRVLLSIEAETGAEGSLRVRQYTRKAEHGKCQAR